MARSLPGFPSEPSHRFTVSLDDALFRVRLVWRHRLRSWYLDLSEGDGTPIAMGRRLSPGWSPLPPVPGTPTGVLWVRGADGYAVGDLGSRLELVYVPADEVPSAASTSLVQIEVAP